MKVTRGGAQAVAACLLAALSVAGCAQGGTTGSAGGDGRAPRLAIASYFPPTIKGHNFRPGEQVVLRAQPRQGGLKPVYFRGHARGNGTFVVRLHGYGIDRCTGFTVTATGSRGSRAVVRSPQFGCPPVRAPAGG